MKKLLIPAIAIVALQLCGSIVYAGKIGNYYATDIKTYMKGELINSYNLGGQTAIVCEDLQEYYGFDVEWREESRELYVVDRQSNNISENIKGQPDDYSQAVKGAVGEVAGEIYSTDIKTYLNGMPVESYNIGGRTIIRCEDMQEYGYEVIWNGDTRELTMNYAPTHSAANIGEVLLGKPITDSDAWNTLLIPYNLKYYDKIVNTQADYALSVSGYTHTVFVPFKETIEALGSEYTWSKESNTLTIIPKQLTITEGTVKKPENVRVPKVYPISINLNVNSEPSRVVGARKVHIYPDDFSREGGAVFVHDGKVYMPLDTIAIALGLDCEDGTTLKEIDIERIARLKTLQIEAGTPIVSPPSGEIMLTKNVENSWFSSVTPEIIITASPHGNMVPLITIASANEPISIKFARKIPKEYLTSTYIYVTSGNVNISNKFNYEYNEETNTLNITLKASQEEMKKANLLDVNDMFNVRVYISQGIPDEEQNELENTFYIDACLDF